MEKFKAVIYLAKQEITFREDVKSEDLLNKGNFVELLENMTYENQNVKEKLQRRYGHYTTPEIQNDIIAESVRKKIRDSLGPYWTLMVDETRDAGRKEQFSFAVRSTRNTENV